MMIIAAAIYAVMLITSWLMGAEILVGIMDGTLLVGSISMMLKDCSAQTFDFKKGCYVHWRLRRTASGVIKFGCDKCGLDDIAALQVIKKRNRSKDKIVYYTYELNIVGYETHSASLEDDVLRIIQQKPADASIYCWVNPDKPQQAIIDRRLQISEELQWLWNPLLFIVIGLAVFTGGVRGRPK